MTASDSFKRSVEISVRTPMRSDFGLKQQHNAICNDWRHAHSDTQTPTEMVLDSREEIAHTPTQPHTKAASSFSSQSALLRSSEEKRDLFFLFFFLPFLRLFLHQPRKFRLPICSLHRKIWFFFPRHPRIFRSTNRKINHTRDRQNLRRSQSSALKRRTIFWL